MSPFDELQRIAGEAGIGPALDYLEQNVRRDKNYPALFEVLKMRVRHRLELPLLYSDNPDSLTEQQQRELEDGLISACREVGTLLMRTGDVQQGWMYLQPVGDRELNQKLLQAIKPDEENIDLLIDTAIAQGAAPAFGYKLLLNHYGTCNGITTFETQSAAFDRTTQKEMAVVLLDHLYNELLDNIRYSMSLPDSDAPLDEDFEPEIPEELKQMSLAEILEQRPQLTEHGAHHIDTTHLASLMRIARLVDDPDDLRRAYQLSRYGNQLAEDFHYPGHPPFEQTYVDHLHYFGALVGEINAEDAVAHFRQKISSVDTEQFGPVAIETVVELLFRLGNNEAALELTIEKLLGQHAPMGIAPDPMSIANTEAMRQKLIEYYRSQNDLVSFAAGVLGHG
ncbi:MAG: hypothetical protein AAFN77_06355 [Planctomycetota bacterium]